MSAALHYTGAPHIHTDHLLVRAHAKERQLP